jgi:hypothetical protein
MSTSNETIWAVASRLLRELLSDRSTSSNEHVATFAEPNEESERAHQLLAYLDRALERERERYRWAEEKTSRYVQVVAFIIAGGVAAAPTAQGAVPQWRAPVFALFLIGYASALVASILTVWFAALVSRVEDVAAMPVDEGTVNTFLDAPLHDTARAAAVTYRNCIEKYQFVSKRRFRAVTLTYRSALIAAAGALFALLAYLFMPPSQMEPKMTTRDKTTTSTPNPTPSAPKTPSQPAPSQPAAQSPRPVAGGFGGPVLIQESDPGPLERTVICVNDRRPLERKG